MDRENKITYYEDGDDFSDDSDMEEVSPIAESADDLLARCLLSTKSDNCSSSSNVNIVVYSKGFSLRLSYNSRVI